MAIEMGNTDIVKILLSSEKINVNTPNIQIKYSNKIPKRILF